MPGAGRDRGGNVPTGGGGGNVFIGPLFGGYISHIGNYRTAEIECFVFVVENDLRRVGIGEGLVTFGCLEGAH